MYRISALFEEDLEIQDALDDIDIIDDGDDLLITAMEERYQQKIEEDPPLFENVTVNKDGFTAEEERMLNIDRLNGELDDELPDEY